MKTATVRDLRYDFPKIEAWITGGEEILITKHSKQVARITAPVVPARKGGLRHPDYSARLQRIWGDRVFTQEEVDEMREFETGEP
jgi:antitoxin (DNA-binding transcriptional repressor) of toxin-antitoxin stability system